MNFLKSQPATNSPDLTVSIQNLKKMVETLSFARPWQSPENIQAKKLIIDQMTSYGFPIPIEDEIGNLAFGDPKQCKTLLGAHYDSCDSTPGADDNGSAVSVLLEVARLSNQHGIDDVCFVAFNAEENDLLGSKYFVNQLGPNKIDQAHIFEMVGYTSDYQESPIPNMECPSVGNFIGVIGDHRSNVARIIEKANNLSTLTIGVGLPSVPMDLLYRQIPQVFSSDHASFWRKNIPATMWTDTAHYRNPNYHRATDTPETLNYEFMQEVTNLMLLTLMN